MRRYYRKFRSRYAEGPSAGGRDRRVRGERFDPIDHTGRCRDGELGSGKPEYPPDVASPSSFYQYVSECHRRTVNYFGEVADGAGIHIGIIDSIKEPPVGMFPGIEIENRRTVFDGGLEDSNLHGERVLAYACLPAPNATYSLYQAAKDEAIGTFKYALAVDQAIKDDVDILNVSYGHLNRGCAGDCPLCAATEKALDAGITVIVAAGNRTGPQPGVRCPAIKEDAIAVAGVVTRCTNDSSTIPRGAYTLPNPDENWASPTEWHCGKRGCKGGVDGTCINDRDVSWQGNPTPSGNKPDILAPVHIIVESNGEPITDSGTSYAAPLVTGGLAVAFSTAEMEGGSIPEPYQARQAVRKSGLNINSEAPKLDIAKLVIHICP